MIADPPGRPRSVSHREILRNGLPEMYAENGFAMAFVASLEEVLDPIVGLLDCLPSHLDPALAPEDVLELLAGWLGLEVDVVEDAARRREIVRRASEIHRRRGTRRGLELLLALTFPDLALTVHDEGGVSWSSEIDRPPARVPGFEVAAAAPLRPEVRAVLERVVAGAKPAHVGHRIVDTATEERST